MHNVHGALSPVHLADDQPQGAVSRRLIVTVTIVGMFSSGIAIFWCRPSVPNCFSLMTNDAAIGPPLIISLVPISGTIVIHALAMLGIFHFIRRQHLLRRTGVRFWRDVAIVSGATPLAGVAHLVEVFIWAAVFVLCGECSRLAPLFTVPLVSTQPLATVTQSCRGHGKCWGHSRQPAGC